MRRAAAGRSVGGGDEEVGELFLPAFVGLLVLVGGLAVVGIPAGEAGVGAGEAEVVVLVDLLAGGAEDELGEEGGGVGVGRSGEDGDGAGVGGDGGEGDPLDGRAFGLVELDAGLGDGGGGGDLAFDDEGADGLGADHLNFHVLLGEAGEVVGGVGHLDGGEEVEAGAGGGGGHLALGGGGGGGGGGAGGGAG